MKRSVKHPYILTVLYLHEQDGALVVYATTVELGTEEIDKDRAVYALSQTATILYLCTTTNSNTSIQKSKWELSSVIQKALSIIQRVWTHIREIVARVPCWLLQWTFNLGIPKDYQI